jgi:hypothetical protein
MLKLTIFQFLIFLIFLSCGQSPNKSTEIKIETDSLDLAISAESEAIYSMEETKILNLPEVSLVMNRFVKIYPKARISSMLVEKPHKKFPYFWIKIGNMTDFRFETWANLYYEPSKNQVFYLDTVHDSIISIEKAKKLIDKNWN